MKKTEILPFSVEKMTPNNVYTRDGRRVRVICTDRKDEQQPIVALVYNEMGREVINSYCLNGQYIVGDEEDVYDLVIHQEIDTLSPDNLQAFDPCLVRDTPQGTWQIAHFGYEDSRTHVFYVAGGNGWRYCIPFKGNESLLGTTKFPL